MAKVPAAPCAPGPKKVPPVCTTTGPLWLPKVRSPAKVAVPVRGMSMVGPKAPARSNSRAQAAGVSAPAAPSLPPPPVQVLLLLPMRAARAGHPMNSPVARKILVAKIINSAPEWSRENTLGRRPVPWGKPPKGASVRDRTVIRFTRSVVPLFRGSGAGTG